MAIYCPKCENEILPYLKAETLRIVDVDGDKIDDFNFSILGCKNYLVSYHLHFCIHCKIVFYEEAERFEFVKLKKEETKNGSKSELRDTKLEKGEDKGASQTGNKKKDN